jgi:hypothetical protein
MMLAVLAAKLKNVTNKPVNQLSSILRMFKPETVLGWHRALVRRKWTFASQNRGGRPRTDQALEGLILPPDPSGWYHCKPGWNLGNTTSQAVDMETR